MSAKVCVVGGGPAGLAASIAMAQCGCAVTVVDCATPPVDKACGEGLLPDSFSALSELGVSIPSGTGIPFRGIRFSDARSSVAADFPNGHGLGIRRTVLHQILTRRAEALGVSLLWGAKNVQLTGVGLSLDETPITADLLIGADGQNSQVRRRAGLDEVIRESRRYGFRRHYRVEPWSEYMELYWSPRCQLYVTPTSQGEVCIALLSPDPKLRLEDGLSDFPTVQARLRGAAPLSSTRGALSVSRTLKRVCRRGVVLIGDASGSVDAITGEGMCLSFKQAVALPQALASGHLGDYELLHRNLARRPRQMGFLLLMLERHPSLREPVLAMLARRPEVFASLLAVHVGASSFLHFFRNLGPNLWQHHPPSISATEPRP